MPLTIPVAYWFLLPRPAEFVSLSLPTDYEDEAIGAPSTSEYAPIPTDEGDDDGQNGRYRTQIEKSAVALSVPDKWRLVKPLLLRYMFPLCKHSSYTISTTTNSYNALPVCVYTVRETGSSTASC